ncbi:hypothetical protein GDO81_019463 [Engystomops pustulosus]|uniref:Uncharacterized protein n=1 Tax=Engystomops pustulosus TaxID=76066 RepID=A0AAV6YCA3_ENGPU|nr:hypothetical protein GDO81_019463 [Engystomops pustulosus]
MLPDMGHVAQGTTALETSVGQMGIHISKSNCSSGNYVPCTSVLIVPLVDLEQISTLSFFGHKGQHSQLCQRQHLQYEGDLPWDLIP